MLRTISTFLIAAPLFLAAPAVRAEPVVASFDFSKTTIELDVSIKGVPLHMLLDTGVNPSVVDLARADALGLPVDRGDAGEASGFGDGKGATIFPSRVEGLTLGGHGFGAFDALATDMGGISAGYGRKLDGILGYSFLSDKIVLVDYPGARLGFLAKAGEADAFTRGCRTRWSIPLKTHDSFPVIAQFRFGAATAPVTFDTGSNGNIGLFQSALDLPGVRAKLRETGSVTRTGARGEAKSKTYTLDAPVGFGPFTVPPGVTVSTYSEQGSTDTRVANVGNRLMASLKLKLLLDYPGETITFYGDCG
ncbi:retropepsin-like aspartic protease [Caulobacter sp.]|uniref:retropepsin-like aspartic protease n=1 Tax=Caulobacter sp. TaxID=78 RepID=UPI002B490CAB|nr:retropepsin-like aspartic protease [Caulobacter sp.]HJV42504.1 retropepsin-like aspartic protease [Caulobacter sp.]